MTAVVTPLSHWGSLGVAGAIQGVPTPDLNAGYPHLVFFEHVAGHLGIVAAALFLVVGMGLVPRPGAIARVFAITPAYRWRTAGLAPGGVGRGGGAPPWPG